MKKILLALCSLLTMSLSNGCLCGSLFAQTNLASVTLTGWVAVPNVPTNVVSRGSPGTNLSGYFVDYISGSDSNPGTNTAAPWEHCPGDPAASGNATTNHLTPGITVYFKGGEKYVLTAGPFGCDGNPGIQITSGTNGAPVTYSGSNGWGTGAAQITDNGSTNKLIAFGSAQQVSNVVINGFNIGPMGGTTNLTLVDPGSPGLPENPGWGIQAGDQGASSPSANVIIENCNFAQLGYWQNTNAIGASSLGNNGPDCPKPSCGIMFSSGLVNSTITNCTFTKSFQGIELVYGINSNVEITACDIGSYMVWGINLNSGGGGSYMDYMRIHNNAIHDIGWAYVLPYYLGYGVGAYHQDMVFSFVTGPGAVNGTNIDFYDNTFYNTPPHTNGSVTGCIYLEGNVSANVYNNLFNVPATVLGPACVSINCDQPYSNSLVRVINNTFVVNAPDNGSSVAITWGGASLTWSGSGSQYFYYWPTNAFIQEYNNIEYDFSTYPAAGGFNHLLYFGNVSNIVANGSISNGVWTLDHNDYLSDRPTQFAIWGNNGLGNYGEFGVAFMQSLWGWEMHGMTNDPLFVSLSGSATGAVNNSYLLQSHSPAIGAGLPLASLPNLPGIGFDITGKARTNYNGGVDLGAYQH